MNNRRKRACKIIPMETANLDEQNVHPNLRLKCLRFFIVRYPLQQDRVRCGTTI